MPAASSSSLPLALALSILATTPLLALAVSLPGGPEAAEGEGGGFWWRWFCQEEKCVMGRVGVNQVSGGGRSRVLVVAVVICLFQAQTSSSAMGLDACKSVCGPQGSLWPSPASAKLGSGVADIAPFAADEALSVSSGEGDRRGRAELEAFAKEAFGIFVADANSSADGRLGESRAAFKDRALKVPLCNAKYPWFFS